METQKTNEKKYTVLTNTVGCKIKGNFTEEEINRYTQEGVWSVAQIE